MITAEEFFRNKLKELQPFKDVITLNNEMITAEQGMRWAHEFKQLHLHSIMQAEGSDVSDGAAVGNGAAGKGVCGGIELAEWLLKNKRSVFLEADISHKTKLDILRKLNYSSDILR